MSTVAKLCAVLYIFLFISPERAHGQDRLVSVILAGDLSRFRVAQQAFEERIAELPPISDVKFYIQNPNPDALSLANSVRKAVAFDAELIIAYGAQTALVAQREVHDTPVLFADVYDPVELGLVRCLEDVSCDVSGVSGSTPLQTLVRIFRTINPDPGRIALFYSSSDPGSVLQCQRLAAIASAFGIEAEHYDIPRRSTLPEILKRATTECQSFFISDSTLVQELADEILAAARKRNLVVFSQIPGLCERGALLTLEPNPVEQGNRLAEYAHAVLDGKPIRSLPIISPKKVDLVINLKQARQRGLTVPFDVLTLATKVVK